ncbi:MAG: PHP domain-containing protein [Armatimonadota bacterium]
MSEACCSRIAVALHIHTMYSACSETKLEEISKYCLDNGISVLGVTDHDTIGGALALKAVAGKLRVIIGSEIKTRQGEIIGLFLKNEIAPGQGALDTCEQIKEQGGLIYLPHPFDPLKVRRLKKKAVLECLHLIDIIEVFNAKTTLPIYNKIAARFAEKHGKAAAVGSDSHYLESIDMCVNEIDDFNTPEEFLENLRHAKLITKRSGPLRGWWVGIKNVLIAEGHHVQRYRKR